MECTHVFLIYLHLFSVYSWPYFLKKINSFSRQHKWKICKDYPQILPFQKANVEHKDCVIA